MGRRANQGFLLITALSSLSLSLSISLFVTRDLFIIGAAKRDCACNVSHLEQIDRA